MVAAATTLSACSTSHHRAASAGAPAADRWTPPTAASPGPAAFCAALRSIYGHMASVPQSQPGPATERILSDYVAAEPVLVADAPASLRPAAASYFGTVAAYLQALVKAGLDASRLPPGTLSSLAARDLQPAYSAVAGYAATVCHRPLGGA